MTDRANHPEPSGDGWLCSQVRSRRNQIRLRSLLLAIAGVALLGGALVAWPNRRNRDSHARVERFCTKMATQHESELAICRSALSRGESYDTSRADNDLEGLWSDFKSWDEEAAWHEEYAKLHRAEASRRATLRQFYQRRLLWPF